MRYACVVLGVVVLVVGLAAQDIHHAVFEKFQVADTPIGFSTATLDAAAQPQIKACEARLETGQLRYRFDGGTVGSTTGILFEIGDVLQISGHATATAFRFVKTGSTTGVVQVTCWE